MSRIAWGILGVIVVLNVLSPAGAFIESRSHPPDALTLSWVRQHAWIAVYKVGAVDAERGVVIYELTEQLQGHRREPDKECPKRMRHLVKLNGKVPPGLDKIQAGQVAICFGEHQHRLFVSYVRNSWYVASADKDEPSFGRIIWERPDLNCLFVGNAADLADAFRELAAGRDAIVRCQKGFKDKSTLFVRSRPDKKQESKSVQREPVMELQWVADRLPNDPASDRKQAVPALIKALASDDRLIRTTAARLLKEIDPAAAKKASER